MRYLPFLAILCGCLAQLRGDNISTKRYAGFPTRDIVIQEVNRFFGKKLVDNLQPVESKNINKEYSGRSIDEVYSELTRLCMKYGEGVHLKKHRQNVFLTFYFQYPNPKAKGDLILLYQYFFLVDKAVIYTVGTTHSIIDEDQK